MKKEAFTLLELIVGMFIFSVIAGLSITALLGLKESIKLKQLAVDIVSETKLSLNNARNNVYTNEENQAFSLEDYNCSDINNNVFLPDAIGYYFTTNSIHKIKCIQNSTATINGFCCKDLGEIPQFNASNIKYIASCGVVFEYSTGDILSFPSNVDWTGGMGNITVNEESCTLRLFHDNLNTSKNIIFDSSGNSIFIE